MATRIAELADPSGNRFLEQPFADLAQLYARVDQQAASVARAVKLPCGAGCSACCRESVLVTPLEALYLLSHLQRTLDAVAVDAVVRRGTALFERHRDAILAFGHPECPGAPAVVASDRRTALPGDHGDQAVALALDCPLLDGLGACSVYAARELRGRLYGMGSLRSTGRYFGCGMAQQSLVGQSPRLVDAEAVHGILRHLPFTRDEQVLPYFLWRYAPLLLQDGVAPAAGVGVAGAGSPSVWRP